MRRGGTITWGIMLVLVGLGLLLVRMGVIPWENSWWLPSIFLGLALYFHVLYFAQGRYDHGLLVPGGIFLTYGILLMISNAMGEGWLSRLMGLWVAGPAVGIAEMKLASRGQQGSWSAVVVLAVISITLILMRNTALSFRMAAGVVLVIWGLSILVRELFHTGRVDSTEKERDLG